MEEPNHYQNTSTDHSTSRRSSQLKTIPHRLQSGAKDIASSIDFRLLGMALPFFCSDMLAKSLAGSGTEMLMMHQLYSGSLLLLAGIIGIFLHKHHLDKRINIIPVSTLGCCALSVSYLVLASAPFLQYSGLYYLAMILGGLGVGICYIKWFSLFSLVDAKVAMASLLVAYSLGSLLRAVFSFIEPAVSLLIAAGLVIVMQVLFLKAFKSYGALPNSGDYWAQASFHNPANDDSLGPAVNFKQMLPFVVMLMLFSFMLSLVRSVNVDTQYLITPNTLNLILRITFPLLLLVFIVQGNRIIRLNTLYQLSLVLVITAVFLIHVFAESNMLISIALTSFIRGLVILFLFLSFAQIIQDRRYSTLSVVGIGWGTYVFAQGLGLVANTYLGLNINDSIALNITYLLVTFGIITLLLTNKVTSKAGSQDAHDVAAPLNNDLLTDTRQERLGAMKQLYGLTDREAEILELICQGRSKRHIADALVISENTVRGHVKNLHLKCGVHTKQELIDLREVIPLDKGSSESLKQSAQ